MMKFNYIIFSSLFLLFIYGCSGQSITPFTPTKGQITIKQQIKISDKELVDNSLEKGFEKFMEIRKKIDAEKVQKYGGPPLSLFGAMAERAFVDNFNPYLMQKNTIEFNFRFDNSKIIYKFFTNGRMNKYHIIDTQKNTELRMLPEDTTQANSGELNYRYLPEEQLIIKEYRKDKKNINGYDCFKVITEDSADGYETYQTLYVTEEIKCKFHPIVKYKSVLEQYYPLEIISTTDLVGGYKKIFTTEKLSLN